MVRPDLDQPGHYFVVAGARRLLAAKRAQLSFVPCVIRDVSEAEAFALALMENEVREKLTRREMMQAVKTLQDRYGWGPREIGRQIRRNPHDVSEMLRVAEDSVVTALLDEVENLTPTALGPLVQSRYRTVREPVIEAIRNRQIRSLSQIKAALEEELSRSEQPEEGHVGDITHLPGTHGGVEPTEGRADEESDSMSPPASDLVDTPTQKGQPEWVGGVLQEALRLGNHAMAELAGERPAQGDAGEDAVSDQWSPPHPLSPNEMQRRLRDFLTATITMQQWLTSISSSRFLAGLVALPKGEQTTLRAALRDLGLAVSNTEDAIRDALKWDTRDEDEAAEPAVPVEADHMGS